MVPTCGLKLRACACISASPACRWRRCLRARLSSSYSVSRMSACVKAYLPFLAEHACTNRAPECVQEGAVVQPTDRLEHVDSQVLPQHRSSVEESVRRRGQAGQAPADHLPHSFGDSPLHGRGMHVRQVAAICLQLAYNLTNDERVPICL